MRAAQPIILVFVVCLAAAPAAAQQREQQPRTASRESTPPTMTSPFFGGVPSGSLTTEPIKLTVIDAILRALGHNLGVLTAEAALDRARGTRWLALADLLPSVSARLGETRQKINLAAFGFGGGGVPSFSGIPDVVGPFNVFDARLFLSQSVFDLEAINSAREEAHLIEAARLSHRGARSLVISVSGTAFVQALAASARAEAAQAQRQTADTLYKQAVDMKQSGLVPGIDVLRAQVQLGAQQQRYTAAANEFEKAKLTLARIIGLPLGQSFTLDANLPDLPSPDVSLDEAVDRALKTRADYQAALERLRAAEAEKASIAGSHLPSVHVTADLGSTGLTPAGAKTTFSVAGSVNVPIFNGGRTQGRLLQADADLRSRSSEAEDLKAAIYYEVRGAFLDLQATSEQLRVATGGRDLATLQLAQSRDRFSAGVASNLEVVQAQEAVALATEQFISAQYGYDLAKGALIRGIGATEETLRQLVGRPVGGER